MKQTGLFANLPQLDPSKQRDKEIVKKASKPRQSKTVVTGTPKKGQAGKIETIVQAAKQNLVDDGTLELIIEEERFREYMRHARQNGIIFFDTETTGLDPIQDKLVGICIYTDGEKPAYIPMHHTDYLENEIPNQLSDEVVRQELKKSLGIKFVYHNAKFDVRVIRNSLRLFLPIYWDTLLAAYFLNENEPHGLKYLWNKYVNKGDKALTFEDLFEGIPFNFIPPSVGYFYAAKDPKMTADVYNFQMKFLDPNSELCKEKGLYDAAKLLRETELPLIPHLVEMEETGVRIDTQKASALSTEYHAKREIAYKTVQDFIQSIPQSKLEAIDKAKRAKLSNPVNIASPTQLAILIYDVLKCSSPDTEKPRGTGEEVLEGLKVRYKEYAKFFGDILEYRGIEKLLSTYIDKIPNEVKKKTNRLHGQFNQYGAKTGRFSSSDPNLQNIPSHNKEIRKMFTATEGYVLLSGDYSQQEPRVLAHVSGDEGMAEAYRTGKDLYAWIASIVYKIDYTECLEFRPDGSKNKDGKKRRDSMKSVVLGLMYGRGAGAIAEQLGISKREAQDIIDMFFEEFPKVAQWIDYIHRFAKANGYVQTVWGRKRRLPDIQLPEYEFEYDETNRETEVDFFSTPGTTAERSTEVDPNLCQWYAQRLANAWGSKKREVKAEAAKQGIKVKDNGGKIADAERQSVNSVIQGTSADITKRAMLLIGSSEELKELGYRMLLTVHDEIIGECPRENALKAREIVRTLMLQAADKISVPMKVDFDVCERWYGEDIANELT